MFQANVRGPAKMLRIYVGQDDRWEGKPLYEPIVARIKTADLAGATVYRGAIGYGAAGRVHRSRLFSHDRPMVVTASTRRRRSRRCRTS